MVGPNALRLIESHPEYKAAAERAASGYNEAPADYRTAMAQFLMVPSSQALAGRIGYAPLIVNQF
jgi:hypothetical protein